MSKHQVCKDISTMVRETRGASLLELRAVCVAGRRRQSVSEHYGASKCIGVGCVAGVWLVSVVRVGEQARSMRGSGVWLVSVVNNSTVSSLTTS